MPLAARPERRSSQHRDVSLREQSLGKGPGGEGGALEHSAEVGETVERACRRRAADPIDRIQAPRQEIALGAKSHHHASDRDRKSTRLNSSHLVISYAVFCLKK